MTTERILATCSVLLTVAMLLAWPESQPMMSEGYTLRYDAPSSVERLDAGADSALEDGDGCTLEDEDAAVCEAVCGIDVQ